MGRYSLGRECCGYADDYQQIKRDGYRAEISRMSLLQGWGITGSDYLWSGMAVYAQIQRVLPAIWKLVVLGDRCADCPAGDAAAYGEALDAAWVERLLLPIDKYVGDPAVHARWFAAEAQPCTGANLVWKVTASALAAVIRQDGEGLSAARNALLPLFTYASEGDGFYEDGSFIQHDNYAYTGGYGVSLLQDLIRLMVWLRDTLWALPAAAQEMTARWIEHSFVPLMFRE